mmetsp:Transcript_58104/g.135350  ORF Transcript_58104/g.135350 Transcript_58104/m.135350 type:complete len:308 (+) Transcript_58104:1-924(+)
MSPAQEGPVMSFVVNSELQAWQKGWDKERLVFHPLGLPQDQYVKLHTSGSAHVGWYLESCSGVTCADHVGCRVSKMRIKGVRGPMVYEFRETSNAMANMLYAMDEHFAKYGGGSNVGIQSTGLMDVMRLHEELSSWLHGFRPYILQTHNQSYFEHLVSTGRHLVIKEIVEASPRLTRFFGRKGWTFESVREEETGFTSQVLHMHGLPVMSRWQLDRMLNLVVHPNWDAIASLRSAIRTHAYDILTHAISKEWVPSPKGFWSKKNPFKGKLAEDPVFRVCDEAHSECIREGIARVELHFPLERPAVFS